MRKIYISFIILLLFFSTQVFAIEDWNKDNKKREEVVEASTAEFMEKYKSDSVPENERIISYEQNGGSYNFSQEEEGIFKATAYIRVIPYSTENTIWDLNSNFLFLEYSIIDGEYVLEWESTTPRNYDKFLERFEEYKKNGQTTVEVETVQGEKNDDIKSNKIEKISNIIFGASAMIFSIVIIFIIGKFIKNRK